VLGVLGEWQKRLQSQTVGESQRDTFAASAVT